MTARRSHTSPTLSPSRTGGDDRPRARCADDWTAFDVLTQGTTGKGTTRKLELARADVLSDRLCGGCDLRQACWDDAHANGEPWFLSLRGKPVPPHAGSAA